MSIALIFGILLIVLIVSLIVWRQMRKARLKKQMIERGFTDSETQPGPAVTAGGPPTAAAVPCVGCDYNLYGLVSDGKCPECSCPIHISIPSAAPSTSIVDEASYVEKDVPCVGCGTDLRGSSRNQLCKTCGAPAWFSVPTTWLRDCDPAWLRRVRSGMTLWLWNIPIEFVLTILGSIVAVIWATQVSANVNSASILGSTTGSIVGVLLNVLVVWRISTPNPAAKNRDESATLRQVTRVGAILAVVSAVCVVLVLLLRLPKFYIYIATSIGIGGWVSSVGLFLCLREFACRVPDRKLIRSITLTMWSLCSATLLLQLLGVGHIWLLDLDSTQTPGTAPPTNLGYTCFMAFVALATIGFTIWLVVALFRLRAAFRSALNAVPEPSLS